MDRLSTITTEQYRQFETVELMRVLAARACASRFGTDAEEYYQQHWGGSVTAPLVLKAFEAERQALALETKAATAPGGTADPAWAGALATSKLAGGFTGLVRQTSVLSKLSVTPVPFATPIQKQISGASIRWIGERAPKPVTKIGLGTDVLDPLKCGGIVVVTRELMTLASPGSAQALQTILVNELTTFVDAAFLSSAVATAANPAGLLNGVTVSTDVAAALAAFFTARPHALAPTWIASAGSIGKVTLDAQGRLYGLPVVISPAAGANVIVTDAAAIAVADGDVELDVSDQAMVEMVDDPVTPTAATIYMSLWQHNMSGIRIERFINWRITAPGAVAFATLA